MQSEHDTTSDFANVSDDVTSAGYLAALDEADAIAADDAAAIAAEQAAAEKPAKVAKRANKPKATKATKSERDTSHKAMVEAGWQPLRKPASALPKMPTSGKAGAMATMLLSANGRSIAEHVAAYAYPGHTSALAKNGAIADVGGLHSWACQLARTIDGRAYYKPAASKTKAGPIEVGSARVIVVPGPWRD